MLALRIPLLCSDIVIPCLPSWPSAKMEVVRTCLVFGATMLGVAAFVSRQQEVVGACLIFAFAFLLVATLLQDLGPDAADADKIRRTRGVKITSPRQSSSKAASIIECTSRGKQPLEQVEEPDCMEEPLLRSLGDPADLWVPPSRINEGWLLFANGPASSQPRPDGASTSYHGTREQYLQDKEAKAVDDIVSLNYSIDEGEIQPVDMDLEAQHNGERSVRSKATRGNSPAHLIMSLLFGPRPDDHEGSKD